MQLKLFEKILTYEDEMCKCMNRYDPNWQKWFRKYYSNLNKLEDKSIFDAWCINKKYGIKFSIIEFELCN